MRFASFLNCISYLGDAQTAGDATTLANLQIGAVCSVGPKSEKDASIGQGGVPSSLTRMTIADDNSARLLPHLREACEWIDRELGSEATDSQSVSATSEGARLKSLVDPASHRSMLVHCRGGMNRSPAVIAAYLIWKYCFKAPESMEMVKLALPASRFGRGAEGVLWQDLLLWAVECAGGGELAAAATDHFGLLSESPAGGSDGKEVAVGLPCAGFKRGVVAGVLRLVRRLRNDVYEARKAQCMKKSRSVRRGGPDRACGVGTDAQQDPRGTSDASTRGIGCDYNGRRSFTSCVNKVKPCSRYKSNARLQPPDRQNVAQR